MGGTRRLPVWRKLPLDPHCSSQEVDILNSERQRLGDPQAKAAVRDHHYLAPRWHCLSQGLHLATDNGIASTFCGLRSCSAYKTAPRNAWKPRLL
jgi:hypothetical protein